MYESINIDPNELQKLLFRRLTTPELQKLYDFEGGAKRIKASFGLGLSSRKICTKLHDNGVILNHHDSKLVKLQISDNDGRFTVEDEFDPEKLMNEVVESDLDPSVFEAMDIREMPKAKNFLDWVMDRKFLGTLPFPRQLQMALALLEEYCPRCSDKVFIKDMHLSPYLGEDGYPRPWTMAEIQERIILLEYSKCPKCGVTHTELIKTGEHKSPTDLAACVGQRGGKTRLAEMLMSYINHTYQMLTPSPQQFFEEDPTQKFSAIFTALELSQASDTLWGAYHLRVKEAPWYKNYHDWLDYHGKKLGVELYRIKDTYHFYANTLLHDVLRPPFAKAMRGRTGYQMGIDEIGLFSKEENRIRANATEVHLSMGNALLTLQEAGDRLRRKGVNAPPAPIICISSPWELLDKIMSLVRTAEKNQGRVAFHYPTWEMNPKIRRNSRKILEAYAEDPVNAERDFGAIPPFARDPYHSNQELIDSLVSDHRPIFHQKTKYVRTAKGGLFVYAIPQGLMGDKVIPRLIAVDSGETSNSFAITVWSLSRLPAPVVDSGVTDDVNEYDEDEQEIMSVVASSSNALKAANTGEKRVSEYLRLDGAIEAMPFQEKENSLYSVHFNNMYKYCLLPLIKSLNIVGVVADRWNVSQTMHSLQDEGVECQRYSLVWNDFEEFHKKTSRREVLIPKPEKPFTAVFEDYEKAIRDAPYLHLVVQYKTVKRVGRKVTKPSGGTDDLYRTMVLAHRFAFDEKAVTLDGKHTFHELLETPGDGRVRTKGLAFVATRGQGGSATTSGETGFTSLGGYARRGSGGASGGGAGSYSNVKTRGAKT